MDLYPRDTTKRKLHDHNHSLFLQAQTRHYRSEARWQTAKIVVIWTALGLVGIGLGSIIGSLIVNRMEASSKSRTYVDSDGHVWMYDNGTWKSRSDWTAK